MVLCLYALRRDCSNILYLTASSIERPDNWNWYNALSFHCTVTYGKIDTVESEDGDDMIDTYNAEMHVDCFYAMFWVLWTLDS